jgi:hypothetical protein
MTDTWHTSRNGAEIGKMHRIKQQSQIAGEMAEERGTVRGKRGVCGTRVSIARSDA